VVLILIKWFRLNTLVNLDTNLVALERTFCFILKTVVVLF